MKQTALEQSARADIGMRFLGRNHARNYTAASTRLQKDRKR
jgi:hypothetical protein